MGDIQNCIIEPEPIAEVSLLGYHQTKRCRPSGRDISAGGELALTNAQICLTPTWHVLQRQDA